MSSARYPFAKPSLIVRSLHPENQEAPIHFITGDEIENKMFYRRNHFSYPTLTYSSYWLPINGSVVSPRIFSMQDILMLPSKTITAVLECAGNKRSLFEPKVFGEQWENGGISQGQWKGVPLRTLLELTGIQEGATEVVVEGYDYGKRTDLDNIYTYSRSLPLEKALHPNTIIAYAYNDQPIPFKHGYPLRLIVPQWYGMASIKWIKQISVVDSPFKGPFQSIDYMYYPNKENYDNSFPVTTINVNSTIQRPLNMEVLNTGKHIIKGIAWTGKGFISKIEISTDSGKSWSYASIMNQDQDQESYRWFSWSYEWVVLEKGEYTIMAKATDSHNQSQPTSPFWNRKGYGYNAITKIKVKIE